LLGYNRVLEKHFGGPGKVLEIFVSKSVGTLPLAVQEAVAGWLRCINGLDVAHRSWFAHVGV